MNFARARLARVQQIEREIGVAAQAVTPRAFAVSRRHELGDDVDAARKQIFAGMRVVGRDVAPLRRGIRQPAAREKEEFVDLHIGRQGAAAHRRCVVECGITAEQTFDDRLQEAPLEFVLVGGLFQRQRGEDAQVDRRSP